ncbi:MAG TPA: hypothetical protein VGL99_23835, partial [Chloroflexota bacterium]
MPSGGLNACTYLPGTMRRHSRKVTPSPISLAKLEASLALTNRQIGEALVIAEGSVATHVVHIL